MKKYTWKIEIVLSFKGQGLCGFFGIHHQKQQIDSVIFRTKYS